jgi:hypothetical protein
MSQLQRVTSAKEYQHRFVLETAFPEMANSRVHPYDTNYLTFPDPNGQRVDALRELLRIYLPKALSYSEEEKRGKMESYYQGVPPEIYSTFLTRLADSIIASILAISGAAALIVPMVIMALNPSLTKSLITTSAAVVIFAFILGFWDRKNVLTLTFAYAAVLVVFVGTSGTPS